MADNRGTPTLGIDQVSTLDVGPNPVPTAAPLPPKQAGAPPSGTQGPIPTAPDASPANPNPMGDPTDPVNGVGIEGEVDVWESRYSMRNFLGRAISWGVLSAVWIVTAVYAWGYDHEWLKIPAAVVGVVLVFLWIGLGLRMSQTLLSHKYRLTTRRLFISTGFLHRETDQIELLRIQDVFIPPQTLMQRFVNVGSVNIVSSEKNLPNYLILGVSDPKAVMDLVWHHARAEQDQRNVRVEQI